MSRSRTDIRASHVKRTQAAVSVSYSCVHTTCERGSAHYPAVEFETSVAESLVRLRLVDAKCDHVFGLRMMVFAGIYVHPRGHAR